MGLREAIKEEMKWTTTENGAIALNTSGSKRLDFFAQSGSIRQKSIEEKCNMFDAAYDEDARDALVLLFHTRNIRGGYGERDTFNQILAHLANLHPEVVEKNLWAVLEFGRAKDLYSLIGTKAEDAMWTFMKEQFLIDLENMKKGKSVSLLAKWIATPDASSTKTKELGKLTAKKLGYSFKTMRRYKDLIRALRAYIDLPEAKMATGRWNEIEYAKCASRFLLKNRNAFLKHDKERYNEYLDSVTKGESKMNMGTVNPCDIFNKVYHGDFREDLDIMWNNLPEICAKKALVICDTSESMWSSSNKCNDMYPGAVAWSLAVYFAQRNTGCLKNLFMTFDDRARFIELTGKTLRQHLYTLRSNALYGSTNLENAFDVLLRTCINGKLTQEDMPEALIIVSDMQINRLKGLDSDNRMTFYDAMKQRYEQHGYKLPQIVFWNVAARTPAFHASMNSDSVSLVSGYSVNIMKDVLNNIGTTPYELMREVIDSDMYANITI